MKRSIIAMQYAIECHRNTNHTYDGKPYEVHLRMVQEVGTRFIHLIPERDIEIVFAAIWAHDVIEDCRQTYNDVKQKLGSNVADIVYALSNEKGRNRKERANEKYYQGIRDTKYATFVKLCDRIANMQYSIASKSKMIEVYLKELPEFSNTLFHDYYQEMFRYLDGFTIYKS